MMIAATGGSVKYVRDLPHAVEGAHAVYACSWGAPFLTGRTSEEQELRDRHVPDGRPGTGVYLRSVQLVSGRYALLGDGMNFSLVPWRQAGDVTVVAISRPEEFAALRPMVEAALGPVVTALAPERAITAAIHAWHGNDLALAAETRVPAPESCRGWARLHRAPRAMALLMLEKIVTTSGP